MKKGRKPIKIKYNRPISPKKDSNVVEIHRDIIRDKITGALVRTDLKKEVEKIKIGIKKNSTKKFKNLEQEFNYYRAKKIRNIKELAYNKYAENIEAQHGVAKSFKDWYADIGKKQLKGTFPKTAKQYYSKGFRKTLNEYTPEGNRKTILIKGNEALKEQIKIIYKVTDKNYQKMSFIKVYEHYAKEAYPSHEAEKMIDLIVLKLTTLSPDAITSIIKKGLIIEELYTPEEGLKRLEEHFKLVFGMSFEEYLTNGLF